MPFALFIAPAQLRYAQFGDPPVLGIQHTVEEARTSWLLVDPIGQVLRQFGLERAFDRRLDRDFNLFSELSFEGFIDFRLKARMLDANDLFFTASNPHEVSPVAKSPIYA
jgi:hypothetical protein